jgi:hypothetical protein
MEHLIYQEAFDLQRMYVLVKGLVFLESWDWCTGISITVDVDIAGVEIHGEIGDESVAFWYVDGAKAMKE